MDVQRNDPAQEIKRLQRCINDLISVVTLSAAWRKQRIVLDLSERILVDQDAVRFLERCETNGVELRNCPVYVREWITRERQGT